MCPFDRFLDALLITYLPHIMMVVWILVLFKAKCKWAAIGEAVVVFGLWLALFVGCYFDDGKSYMYGMILLAIAQTFVTLFILLLKFLKPYMTEKY